MNTRLSGTGNNGLPSGSVTILLGSLGLILPFSLDGVGPGMVLKGLLTWRLQVPIVFDLAPLAHPHCLASAPRRCTECQVIAPHWHEMEVFIKRKRKEPQSS